MSYKWNHIVFNLLGLAFIIQDHFLENYLIFIRMLGGYFIIRMIISLSLINYKVNKPLSYTVFHLILSTGYKQKA